MENSGVLLDNIPTIYAGHSLGGNAALRLATKDESSRAISFNGGAPATNPVLTGPGPDRATSYHIFGDLVSTHISPEAANVIRIKKMDNGFGLFQAHSSNNILQEGSWEFSTAEEEDEGFDNWSNSIILAEGAGSLILAALAWRKKRSVSKKNPIPGSLRASKGVKKPRFRLF